MNHVMLATALRRLRCASSASSFCLTRQMTVSAQQQSMAGKRLMSYADYFVLIYDRRRCHVTYSAYEEIIERSRARRGEDAPPPPPPPPPKRDPHHVLGVVPGCSPEVLKATFRKRVWELHPDRQQFAASRDASEMAFKELSEAYRILSGLDGQRRWPFGRTRFTGSKRPAKVYRSIFLEFMGVTRVEDEKTLPHVARSVLCDRLVPFTAQ